MSQYIQAVLTVLSLINPVICAAIFEQCVRGKTPATKAVEAAKAILAVAVILCLAALAGAQLLKVFNISLPAFQTAGGVVLVWMGFLMLRGNTSPTSTAGSAPGENAKAGDSSLAPLILFAASPGTITGVITLSVSHAKHDIPVTALVAIVVALSITLLIMLVASRTSDRRKPGLLHDVTTRFMGLIVLAIGVQFALTGLADFFQKSSTIGAIEVHLGYGILPRRSPRFRYAIRPRSCPYYAAGSR